MEDRTITTKPHPEIHGMGMRIRVSNGWYWVLTKYVLVAISLCMVWIALKHITRKVRSLPKTITTHVTTGENPTTITRVTPKHNVKLPIITHPRIVLTIASLGILMTIVVHIVKNSDWTIFDRFTIGSGNLNTTIDQIHSEPIDSTKPSYNKPDPSDPNAIANSRHMSFLANM